MSIKELYDIQVNEGELSRTIISDEGNELLEMYKKIENVMGFEFVNELGKLSGAEMDMYTERAYLQGFKDSTNLFRG